MFDWRGTAAFTTTVAQLGGYEPDMAEARREVALLLLLLMAGAWPPALPHPTLDGHPSPPTTATATLTDQEDGGKDAKGWSLWDTVLRVDQLLQRPNDYNSLMFESGEHDDELSRMLFKRQEHQRREERYIGHSRHGSGNPEENTVPVVDSTKLQMLTKVQYIDAHGRPSVYWV